MALSRFIMRRLNDTCTRKTFVSVNVYGDATYSTATATYQCRREEKLHMVVGSNGKDVLARGFLVVGPTTGGTNPTVEPQDLITLSDGTNPPIVMIETYAASDGIQTIENVKIVHYG